jgi:MFS family permease
MTAATAPQQTAKASGAVLITLASAQFLMTLDSSVMNVSIATVAKDVGTTVTGIQTAITMYTLVMASLMITGGKIGQIWEPQAGVRDRLRDLWVWLPAHRALPEPGHVVDRLVLAGGNWCRADHACGSRAGRLKL